MVFVVSAQPTKTIRETKAEDLPPAPKHAGIFDKKQNREQVGKSFEKLNTFTFKKTLNFVRALVGVNLLRTSIINFYFC